MRQLNLRLLLADDHDGLLREIVRLLADEFEIVGTANNGAALVDLAAKLKPDVVVTDVKMPELSGIDAARKLLALQLCKAVVALTMYIDLEVAKAALEAGILGYVAKVDAGEDLIPAIYKAAKGETFLSSTIASKLSGHGRS